MLFNFRLLGYKFSMFLFSPKTVYELDRDTVEVDGISEKELMRRAGERVWITIIDQWPGITKITLFAGPGNNGGDAYVVALAAADHGVAVQFIVQGDMKNQSDTAAYYRRQWLDAGGQESPWQQQQITGEVIVDGLLGIGLSRELDDQWQELIGNINEVSVPRVSIDIPSGLNAATGIAQPVAVEATKTVTFIGRKTGQYVADGPDYCGEVIFDDLGSTQEVRHSGKAIIETLDSIELPQKRRNNAHKNQFGHVMLVGGAGSMSGAVGLAAKAALRSGAGLVTAFVAEENRSALASIPELMVDSWTQFENHAANADAVVLGPGLLDCESVEPCLQVLDKLSVPLIADAGALHDDVLRRLKRERLLITPHPGEAARLLSISTEAVQNDRISTVQQLVGAFAATCVLKGSGSLVGCEMQRPGLNLWGNPGMATAGSGDVLAGMVAAFVTQGMEDFAAMKTAVAVHALAADLFCHDRDPVGLIASDIIDRIPEILFRLRQDESTAG